MNFLLSKRPSRQTVINMIQKHYKKEIKNLGGKAYSNFIDHKIDKYYQNWDDNQNNTSDSESDDDDNSSDYDSDEKEPVPIVRKHRDEEDSDEDAINCSSDDDPKVVKACNQVLKKHKNDNKFDQDDWDSDLENELQHEQYIKKRIYHNEYYKKVLSEQIVCPACHKTFVKKNIRRHERSTYHHKHGQE